MISRRTLELFTAALTGAFGAAILVSSVRIGVGWTPRGLASGAFPAIAAALIVAGSLYNFVRAAARPGPIVVAREHLRGMAAMFLPAIAFVAAVPFIGMHVAAGVYIFAVVAAQHRWPAWRALAIGIVTAAALWTIFDWGFSVTLPRGMLGNALGF